MESMAGTGMAHAAGPHSAGDDEEEEARLWEELERLPTPQRARSAIVTLEWEGEEGASSRKAVVDVGRLGPGQRRALVDRLVGSDGRDNERFLRELRERIDRKGFGFIAYVLLRRSKTRSMGRGRPAM